MAVLPYSLYSYSRRKTRVVMVGSVAVGGDHPLRLQSMTTTRTQDTDATVTQAIQLIQAGCEIVRITAPTEVDAANLKNISAALRARGHATPLVADIHFRPEAAWIAADFVEKVRINPGNFVDAKSFKTREYTDAQYRSELARLEERFTPLVLKLKKLRRALRIGTNHGSLSDRILNRYGDTPEGMVESALEFVRVCEKNNYHDIILSMKSSNPRVMIAAYRLLAARMDEEKMDYPFHLGVTEAGDGEDGRIKSAVGIGALLEDGIGDTLRVSLTEDPEKEIPFAACLAAPYQQRPPTSWGIAETHASFVDDIFHYSRRKTEEVRVGPIVLGGGNPPRAVTVLTDPNPQDLLRLLEKRFKSGQGIPPEIILWPVRTKSDIQQLGDFKNSLKWETSRIGFLARVDNADLLISAAEIADATALGPALLSHASLAAPRLSSMGKPLWLWGEDALSMLEVIRASTGTALVAGLTDTDVSRLLHQTRSLVAGIRGQGKNIPIHITLPAARTTEDTLLRAAVLAGSLLCDGVGDSLSLAFSNGIERDLDLIANLLQGAGARISKAEFVSCPSCGRTLFDLQTTTDRIKKRTGHLTNIKIAIMGCIVNGPGEMADADFGYVGGGPGKINLYVGKNCVEKGLPAEVADDRLVALIKEHGKWKDPL